MEIKINRPQDDFTYVDFGDKRLNARLQQMVENSTKKMEKTILSSGEGRSEAKGFYRLLGNDKFDMWELEGAAYASTLGRMSGTVLLIQDTSDINLNGHKKTEGLGYSSERIKGIKVHSCIAVSPEGIPYGLLKQSYETREEAKSKQSAAEKNTRPIEGKESYRWVETLRETTDIEPEGVHYITVCDREGDFYELYAEASELETDFVIRVTHDRNCDENEKTAAKIRGIGAVGRVTVNIPRDSRSGAKARTAEMEVAYCHVSVHKPANVTDKTIAPKIGMNLVRITELSPPDGHEAIEWILSTNLPIGNAADAMTIVEYYIQRWKIERFHYVLKSGCNAEKIQQRSFERIKPVLLIYSVIALYIMTLTYLGRVIPDAPCNVFLSDDEWKILYRIVHKTKVPPDKPYSMAVAVKFLGELGSYKRAPSDGQPGLQSIWKGLFALYFAIDLFMGQV